jgi:hypothetical protein
VLVLTLFAIKGTKIQKQRGFRSNSYSKPKLKCICLSTTREVASSSSKNCTMASLEAKEKYPKLWCDITVITTEHGPSKQVPE